MNPFFIPRAQYITPKLNYSKYPFPILIVQDRVFLNDLLSAAWIILNLNVS